MMNMQHFSSAQAITAALPLMSTYWHSVSVQNLLPANTMHHSSGQHTGAFSVGHVQCFCNSRNPMLFLLQLGARQVTLLMPKVVTSFFY